jgi:hypothetical protein
VEEGAPLTLDLQVERISFQPLHSGQGVAAVFERCSVGVVQRVLR